MKKKMSILTILILTMSMFIACGGTTKEVKETTTENQKFNEEDGLMVYSDKDSSPFEDCDLKMYVKSGDNGYVKFVKLTKDGKETKDYYKFDYTNNKMEKYYTVSAMGTSFYYTYDLEKNELVKVEGKDHEDKTESTKSSGRWESGAEKTKQEVQTLEEYFEKEYKVTIKEACTSGNFGK